MARAWCDAGRFYVDVSPEDFQVPEEDGLVDWLQSGIDAMQGDPDLALIVAEVDGEVAGWVGARIVMPASDAQWQLQREHGAMRLVVDAVAVAEDHRGADAGVALVHAAERWGREHGATVAVADGNCASDVVNRFYETRLGFRRRSVSLRKAL
jgi:GNAT superfamily N-acetyltransferase